MHYYQFNIGDYRKDTSHLSLLEHGIYRLLLDTYYLDEGPLCSDKAKLMRTHCIRSADEVQALENVLEDFFELTEDGYFHKKCDEELTKVYEKSAKARAAAEKRWDKKRNKNKGNGLQECERIPDAMRTHSERNADGMLPNTQYPIPNKEAASSEDGPPDGKSKNNAVTLKTHLERVKQAGEKPIPPDDPVFEYAKSINLPVEFLQICWHEFKDRHTEGPNKSKRQKSWRQTFQNCVRSNWYKLWWLNPEHGQYQLTTTGEQAKRNMESRRAA